MSATVDKSSKILVLGEDDRWIAVNPKLVQVLGRNEAEFVQVLHYWLTTKSGMIRDGVRWIYNTYDQWKHQQGHLSKMTIRRIVRKLERLGVILSANFNKKKSDRTKWYTLAYDVLLALVGKEDNHQQEETLEKADKKMNSPCVQNDHITTKRVTTLTSLKGAKAPQTFQPRIEEEPKDIEPTKPPLETDEVDSSFIEQQALQILEEVINPHLDQPLTVFKPLFKNTLLKRMKTHFGQGKTGLERFKEYCTQYAMNAFLVGKKAMKSGDRFVTSVGSILSEKMIEDSWQGRGFFYLYAPPPSPSVQKPEEEDMGRRAQPIPLPPLLLEDVLATAETPLDQHVKQELYQLLGEHTYKTWFHTTGFVARGMSKGEPVFFINSAFAKDYVLDHYGPQLKQAFQKREEKE